MNTPKVKAAVLAPARRIGLRLDFEFDDLPHCCGARVMGGFEPRCYVDARTTSMPVWYAETTPKERQEAIEGAAQFVEAAIKRMRESSVPGRVRQIAAIATTVHDPGSQRRALIERVLELAGMKCVKTWVNSNTANTLNMWVSGD